MADYDPASDGWLSYDLAIACMREMAIRDPAYARRLGVVIRPRGEREARWKKEGIRPWRELESLSG